MNKYLTKVLRCGINNLLNRRLKYAVGDLGIGFLLDDNRDISYERYIRRSIVNLPNGGLV